MTLTIRTCAVLSLLLGLAACAGVAPKADESRVAVVSVQQWGGMARPTPGTRQSVTKITLHHQGEIWPENKQVAPYLRALQRWSMDVKRWSDIPYHYIVSPDGTVYQGRSTSVPGDTNTEYDPSGHVLVMLLGNFEVQTPTPEQWDSTVDLLAELLRSNGLNGTSIGTHRQYSSETVCPGENLSNRFEELRMQVAQRLRRPA